MTDSPFEGTLGDIIGDLAGQYQQAPLFDDIADHVRNAFDAADQHRRMSGIESEMLRCLRAVKCILDPEDAELVDPEEGTDIYLPIINLKHRGLRSWITDILANNEDAPWTLKPTPLPELPPPAENAVVVLLREELAKYGSAVDIPERAAFFKDVAQKHVNKVASEAARRMEVKIQDKLIEGGWRKAFDEFIADIATYPGAVLKGPYLEKRTVLKWVQGVLTPVEEDRFSVKRISPFDIYPSPNSTDTNDGDYIIERTRLSKDQLLSAIGMTGFDDVNIRGLVEEYPDGFSYKNNLDGTRDSLENTDSDNRAGHGVEQRYDICVYYGKLPVSMLAARGVKLDNDAQGVAEVEVWECGGRTLRAMLNPHPLGHRRLYTTSFDPIPGAFWGRALPTLLRDVARTANASARALVRNMAYSSGPIGEYDIGRLVNETKIEQVAPYRMYAVDNDKYVNSTNSAAIRFTDIPDHSGHMSRVIDHFMKLADDFSGIPAYVLGAPQVAGAGRTLGGLSLLMGNAAKGIKHIISNIDRYITEPLVTNFYTMLMLIDDDPTLKVDVTVVARGSSGLLQRELQQARAVEVLQMLTPFAQAGIAPVEGLQIVIRDVLRGLGYSADDIVPDPERAAKLTSITGGQAVTTQPATPPPQLDGRSTPPPSPADQQRLPSPVG